jgi:hypothetical protein
VRGAIGADEFDWRFADGVAPSFDAALGLPIDAVAADS